MPLEEGVVPLGFAITCWMSSYKDLHARQQNPTAAAAAAAKKTAAAAGGAGAGAGKYRGDNKEEPRIGSEASQRRR